MNAYRKEWKPKTVLRNNRNTASKQRVGLTPKEREELTAEIVKLSEQIAALKDSEKSALAIVKEKQETQKQLKIHLDNHFKSVRIFYTHIHMMR